MAGRPKKPGPEMSYPTAVDVIPPAQQTKRGRPAKEFSDDERRYVMGMVLHGMGQDAIADIMGIDAKTLRAHFRQELDHGKDLMVSKVATNLLQIALGKDKAAVTAGIFILKCRGGWREAKHYDDTDANAAVVIEEPNPDRAKMDADEWAARWEKIRRGEPV